MNGAPPSMCVRVIRCAVSIAVIVTVLDACTRRALSPKQEVGMTDEIAMASPDTARGIVRRVGADPLSRLALLPVPPRAAPPLALSGVMDSELQAAEGLEVMVAGRLTTEISREVAPGGARVFTVQRFAVRAADGVEAHDGRLVSLNGRWYLESTPDTRVLIVGLPGALTGQVGARIFLVGPLNKTAQAFGVLRAK
jgi:hypothetical protein